MKLIKANIFKLVIILILLSSGILCEYSLWHYNLTVPNVVQNVPADQGKISGNNMGPLQHSGANSNTGFGYSGPHNSSGKADSHASGINMKNSGISSIAAYSPLFFVYAIAFFGLSAAAYYFFMKKKLQISIANVKLLMFMLLATGLLLRITLALLVDGYPGDISLFKNWALSVSSNFSQFYSGTKSSDYPPLYIYVLYLVGKIGSIGFSNKFFILLLKFPSIVADIITSFLIYKIGKNYISLELSVLISAFYIFNPAIFINSCLWGQVDSFFTLIVAAALLLLAEKKLYASTIMFTCAVLMKPQGIIFLPVLFFELVRQKNIKKFAITVLIALLAALVIVLPFSYNKEALWIFKLYSSTVSEYPYASLNAYNFFSLIGANYAKDSSTILFISYKTFGMLFIILTTLFSWYIYIKAKDSRFAPAAALIQIAGVFTFSVGMHERYLFPAVALATLAYIYLKDKRILLIMLGFSCTSYINMHTVLFKALQGAMSTSSTYDPTVFATSILNVILFLYLVKVMMGTVKTQD